MTLYFAFGSNMDLAQMQARCPGARRRGVATLDDHRIVFRGPSRKRGAGVASFDPAVGHIVRGLLFEVTERDLETLDRYEGAPEWYVRQAVDVRCEAARAWQATAYRLPGHVLPMAPTPAYLEQVARARRALGFPAAELDAATRWVRERGG